MLHEHAPENLLNIKGFCDMGKDAIERWHQTHTRCHARARSLRSVHKQKKNQAKHKPIASNDEVNNVVTDIEEKKKEKKN